MYSIEYNSFLTIKLSLDLSIVPIKKCLIIFHLYLASLFGNIKPLDADKKYIRLTKGLRKELEKHEKLGDPNPVEQFYKRHIIQTNENPIPQILIVGILRILLTTCPTATRTSGGIDLHREWVSSVKLCAKHPEIYDEFIAPNKDKSLLVHDQLNDLISKVKHSIAKQKQDKSEDQDEDDKEGDEDESNSEEEVGNIDNLDIAVIEDYKYENHRHSLITAKFIGLILLFIQRHFQNNHIIQCVYLSSLIVDANGVLVLLKFINQDFSLIDNKNIRNNEVLSIICCDKHPDEKSKLISEALIQDEDISKSQGSKKIDKFNKYVIEDTISPLLHLMYKVSVGQCERIKNILIQYKAINIMKRIALNFKDSNIKIIAYKIIMIQIKYMDKGWKKDTKSMKIISQVYENVDLKNLEDWILANEEGEILEEELNQKEIGDINKDFNIRYYWQNLEKIQDEYEESDGEGDENHTDRIKAKPLEKTLKITNEYYKLMLNTPPLTQEFKDNYEQWLEDEVWDYYD